MSKKMKQTFKMTALAAALVAAYGSALADGPVNYLYGSVPAEGPESSISAGIGSWSNDRRQGGIYDGMRDSDLYLLLDADMVKRDEASGTWLGLKARYLGLDDREIKLDWQRQGRTGLSLEYSRIPRDNQLTFNTGVTGIGTTILRVPLPSITAGTGTDVELGTTRDRVTAKFFQNLGVGLNFNVSFRNEDKEGTRLWGRGGAAEFAVEPIDSTTRILDAALNYSRGGFQLSGGYYGTSYANANTYVDTARINGAGVLSAQYYLSLPLDSQSHELFLNGGYNFTPTTRGTFKLSYSQATQDENLSTPPNPALVDSRAPTHLDGRLDTTLVELGLTSRPMRELSIVANLRYRDFADKTPTQQYVYTGTAMWNTPFSYTNKLGKLEATYLLPQAFSLLGGIEYQTQDRTAPTVGEIVVPFARKLDEASYRVQLRKSMSETVTGSLSYLYQERDGSDYVSSPKAFENLIHPMNIADRQRDKLRAMLDWSPMQQLNLQFAIDDNRDKYNGGGPGSLGLQDGTSQLYSVDASYQVSSGWQVHAWVSRDESEANEITNRDVVGGIDTGNRKYNTLRETGTSFGAGVKGKVSGRLKVGGNVEQFRSVNEYEQTLVGGSTLASLGLVPTPDITNKLLRVKLYAKYAVEKNAELGLNVIRELWRTDDWSWNMFPASGGTTPFEYCGTACTTTGSDGTTVTAKPAQNSTFIGIRYIYRF